ncbi:MAG: VOC family protein [Ignavibacteriae bacterium]|nr:VOC family protein [Ignavibacteriota bacterium]
MNRSMPPSIVIPVLSYPDVGKAVEWLCRAFGFVERLQIKNHRSQLLYEGGSLIITERTNTQGEVSLWGAGYSTMVRVKDIIAHYNRAKQSGARILSPPTDYPYGERQYTVADIGGYVWTFSQTIADVDPEDWGGILAEQQN